MSEQHNESSDSENVDTEEPTWLMDAVKQQDLEVAQNREEESRQEKTDTISDEIIARVYKLEEAVLQQTEQLQVLIKWKQAHTSRRRNGFHVFESGTQKETAMTIERSKSLSRMVR